MNKPEIAIPMQTSTRFKEFRAPNGRIWKHRRWMVCSNRVPEMTSAMPANKMSGSDSTINHFVS
jgi:hypothetical protein